jgi:hypothetical protein
VESAGWGLPASPRAGSGRDGAQISGGAHRGHPAGFAPAGQELRAGAGAGEVGAGLFVDCGGACSPPTSLDLATGPWWTGSAQASPWCGAASRIGPGPLRGSLTSPRPDACVLRCALHGPFAPLPPLLSPVAWLPGACGSERLLLFPLAAPAVRAAGSDPV